MTTVTLRPNAAGDLTQCSEYPTSGSNYDKVNETVEDEDATYVYAPIFTNAYYEDLYKMPASGIPVGSTINSVTVYAYFRNNKTPLGGSTSANNAIKTHSVLYLGTTWVPGTSYALFSDVWTTNPNTLAAWTIAEIDALQVGCKLRDVSNLETADASARCTQIYVVVDYTPPVSAVTARGDGLTWIVALLRRKTVLKQLVRSKLLRREARIL